MKKEKTVKDAAKTLPVGSRRAFLELWDVAGCMDLYDGELKVYFQIIKQVLEREKNKQMEKMKNEGAMNWEQFKKFIKDEEERINKILKTK